MQPAAAASRPAVRAAGPEPAPAGFLASLNLDFQRVYYNAIVGGFGGLVGWLLVQLVGQVLDYSSYNVYLRMAIVGLLAGVGIGFAVGGADGIIGSRSVQRMWQGGRYGAVLGAIGGLVGLVLGELAFNLAGGGIWPRAFGWGLFGMLVGTSEGVANKMPEKIKYGILGGLLGGMIGGSTYQGLMDTANSTRIISDAAVWGSAIGLVIVGACIGFLISLVETLMRKAWLFFLTGRLEGQTRTLDSSRPHTLGSSPSCSIVIPNDPSVVPVHAEVAFVDGEFQVRPRDGQVTVRGGDGRDQTGVINHVLAPGDRVVLGDTRMIFRNVEGKKKS